MTHAIALNGFSVNLERQELARQAEQTAFELEGLEALRHYEETGLHITGEEFKQYLADRKQGKKVELPKCHV